MVVMNHGGTYFWVPAGQGAVPSSGIPAVNAGAVDEGGAKRSVINLLNREADIREAGTELKRDKEVTTSVSFLFRSKTGDRDCVKSATSYPSQDEYKYADGGEN